MTTHDQTFLTGATGFVGAAVARILLEKGHSVKVLARKSSSSKNLTGLNLDVVEGDLTEPESYGRALADCRTLFHVAADYRIWTPDPEVMHRINVIGTKELMLAALRVGIKRIVYTSSVATLGRSSAGTLVNEETPSHLEMMIGTYKRSKYLAEQEVHHLIANNLLPAIIVNPSTPIGPRDIRPTPTGRIILDSLKGRIPAYIDTGLNVVHVDDVATGHYLAFEKGVIGSRYILGGENLDLEVILKMVAEISQRPPPTLRLPSQPLYPIAAIMELIARVTGKEPLLTRDALRMASKKMFFSSSKAERELGYKARPARQAIQDAVTWFRENGYV